MCDGRGGELVYGAAEVARLELAGQPTVQWFEQRILAEGHIERVVYAVGERVLAGEAAAVVRRGGRRVGCR